MGSIVFVVNTWALGGSAQKRIPRRQVPDRRVGDNFGDLLEVIPNLRTNFRQNVVAKFCFQSFDDSLVGGVD